MATIETGAGMAELRLQAFDAAERVAVPPDTDVVIALREVPTTGFRWRATEHDGLDLVSDEFTADDQGGAGGGGLHVFRLRPRRRGPVRVLLRLERRWETADAPEAYEFHLDIG